MAQNQITLMDPPIEGLLDKVDSKFTLVALASRRARQVNSYYNSLGEGLGVVVPPQVASASGKPLSIAFEEVAAGKATYSRPDPEEVALAEAAALALLEGEGADAEATRLRRDGRLAGRTRPARGRDDVGINEQGMTSPRDGDAPFVVLGVSAGIAAYKAVEVCRRLVDAGIHVAPVLTDATLRFVGRATFDALASERAQTSLWDEASPIPHTRLGQKADLVVVAPATADLLARYAGGFANDLLTATLLATTAPVVVCPAMHTEMWEHPAVRHNLDTLRRRGVVVVPPERVGWPGVTSVPAGWPSPGHCRHGAGPAGRPPRTRGATRWATVWPACGWWCLPVEPASRSIRSGSSPTDRRGSKGTRWPTPPAGAAPRWCWSPPARGRRAPGVTLDRVETAADMEEAMRRHAAHQPTW